MGPKRKREEFFDPNKSDPEDENFEPVDDGVPRRLKKKNRTKSARSSGGTHRKSRYKGDDIVNDDESQLDDSEGEDSFEEGNSDNEEEEEEEEDLPVNALGRRSRKAAVTHRTYKESSDSDDFKDSDAASPAPTKKKMVIIKVPPGPPVPQAQPARKSTRAHTEETDLVELSTSGRHVVPARASRSVSPEAAARATRSSRAMKGLKTAPETIEEATQESSLKETQPSRDSDQEAEHPVEAEDATAPLDEEMDEQEDDGPGQAIGEDELATITPDLEPPAAAADDDEEDLGPRTRRTRSSRQSMSGAAAPGVNADDDGLGRRRLTRRSRLRKSKSLQEPSSDFEPGEESAGEGAMSDSSVKGRGDDDDDDDDGEFDGPPVGGRRATRKARRSAKSSRRGGESADELDIDQNELAEELHELRQDRQERRPVRRRHSPDILYQEPRRGPRATAKPVNYFMPPVALNNPDDEPEDPAPTPARGGRRGVRGGASQMWERPLNTTYGPFGGGGAGSLLGGPWGTGATGGVESDSSDDEMGMRSNMAGNVGMTPTSAAPPGLIGAVSGALNAEGVGATPNVGKIKDRKALADADPLGVDMNVNFTQVGGLQGHIDKLKEMVQLPLLYPELFLKFHVTPPRGVLFHGPPGTGKTLLARALANSVSSGGKKISFYMRKGADALSKWVGEAEKQLRLLFDEARRTQPSIIFFDEIDGLAPVRSSKQEQIHASIVSTLLALMDGMDGRGQVIVIGATNRPDNIDPALRRPGRFDREFYFPLPDMEGRRAIVDINTKDWGLSDQFKTNLAERTKGYGGADLRAMCTEAALNSIQRAYPQIYSSQEKLIVDADKIAVHATDFMLSIKQMVPSSERSTASGSSPLPSGIEPLLREQFDIIKKALDKMLPRKKKTTALEEAMYEQYDDGDHGFGKEALHQEFERTRVFRPRFLMYGLSGMGQSYLASAVLHHFEGVHVQTFDLPSLLADGRPMEQVIVGQFTEIKRHKPSVIFIPNMDTWYTTMKDTLGLITFQTMLKAIPPTDPVLLLATAECDSHHLPAGLVHDFFGYSKKNTCSIERPGKNRRREYFSTIVDHIKKKPIDFPDPLNRKKRVLEVLSVAQPPPAKAQTRADMKALEKRDRQLLNVLKVQLQPIMDQINRKYKKLRQPVIPFQALQHLYSESDPNYVRPDVAEGVVRPFEIVKDKHGNDVLRETSTGKTFYNLEIITIEERLSNGFYCRPKDFLFDVKSLAKDARNVGDKERTLKCNELVSNVEVDVANVEHATSTVDWEALYQRQVRRANEVAEKERKRRALQSIVDRVQSDNATGHDSDSQQGPVTLGEPIPGARTTMARFQVMSPLSNGHGNSGSASNALTNGGSGSLQDGDVVMGGVDDPHLHGEVPQMGPPPLTARAEQRQAAGAEQSQPTTQGAGAQISQKSAVTSLPAGMSPSAVANDASTTKTSDPSNKSSNWSTQVTNGYHGPSTPPDNEMLPDTQPLSQVQSSGELWPPSQPTPSAGHSGHANPGAVLTGSPPQGGSFGGGTNRNTTPSGSSKSQVPTSHPTAAAAAAAAATEDSSGASGGDRGPSVVNLLQAAEGTPTSEEQSQSQLQSQSTRNSGSSSSQGAQQVMVPPESELKKFLGNLTDKTSGCTIEQLEQINRELMEEVWRTRSQWNRNFVLNALESVFNETIQDIEDLQGVDRLSQ